MLLNPVRRSEIRSPPRPADMVFLVDCSKSMGLSRPNNRLEQVKRGVRRCDPAGAPYGQASLASAVSSRRPQASRILRADEDATLLLDALQRLPARFGADRPAGVVIFSDGRTTETTGFQEAAESYRRSGTPLHVFPVNDQA